MIKRAFAFPGTVFLLVCLWKIALWAVFALPIPSNDAFFYDGPVVNFLLHGKYANPPLGLALPISGHELFSAYPPLYQGVLLGWMACFGTSAFAAMGLHVLLFCIYAWLLFLVLRRVNTPLGAMHLATGFLLLITFTDRPDSLAHVLGLAAIYSWVRASRALSANTESSSARHWWWWAMAAFAILALATGLQIGALYSSVLFVGVGLARILVREKVPWAPLAAIVLLPAALIGYVIQFIPLAWTGFLEHAAQTPSFTGLRFPRPDEVLKLLRTVPGLLISPFLLLFLLTRDQLRQVILGTAGLATSSLLLMTASTMLPAVAMLVAAMFVLTANSVLFTLYLQPLIVGGTLALCLALAPPQKFRLAGAVVLALMALGSIRAVGLTTWGVACSVDLGCTRALAAVRSELAELPPGTKVVLSSAYLYQAERIPNVKAIHSDWMQPADRSPDGDWRALTKLRPTKLVLTQFDFYRRYQPLLRQLEAHPELATFDARNTAFLPAPDSIRPLRRVLQHISWAPVIVMLDWRSPTPEALSP